MPTHARRFSFGKVRAKHLWDARPLHGIHEVSILRPPLPLAIALTPASGAGLGRPLERTWAWSHTTIEGTEFIAEFLAGESRVVLETTHPRVESR